MNSISASNERSDSIVVFDFFCGCGGTSRGFQLSGMDIVWALDNNPVAAKTFKLNFPTAQFHCKSIDELEENDLKPLFEKHKNKMRLFCGCAPCQPFTKQKTRKKSKDLDVRYPLLISFGNIISHYKPEFVFVENVPGVQKALSEEPGPFQEFLAIVQKLNYNVKYKVVRAQDYGAAQIRRRFVLLASRVSEITLPPITHGDDKSLGLLDYVTVKQQIADLPAIAAGEHFIDPEKKIFNHQASELNKKNLLRIQATPHDGGNRLSWPKKLQLKCHSKKRVKTTYDEKNGRVKKVSVTHSGHTDVYGRLWWNRPATGLTTRCNSYSNGRFGHPEQDRAISIREAARLQGFDDEFIFTGSVVDMARQIGNAVPIPLAQAVGKHLYSLLEEKRNNDGGEK